MDWDCTRAREELLDLQRGRLDPAAAASLRVHLEGCAACRQEERAEATLDEALQRLPRHPAPEALRRRVAALRDERVAARGGAPARRRRLAGRAAVAALALLSAGLLLDRQARAPAEALDRLADEVVTDHLRLLASAHPHDLESGVNHEVKPWFEGRLDFAPAVPPGQGELRLLGGAVGYVLERKAAVVSYALGRHRVTLLAFPTAGLAWPTSDRALGGVPVRAAARRGFGVVLWRDGALGYALVSDVGARDLEQLAAALAPQTRR